MGDNRCCFTRAMHGLHSVGFPPNCLDMGLPVRTWHLHGLHAKVRGPCRDKSDRVAWCNDRKQPTGRFPNPASNLVWGCIYIVCVENGASSARHSPHPSSSRWILNSVSTRVGAMSSWTTASRGCHAWKMLAQYGYSGTERWRSNARSSVPRLDMADVARRGATAPPTTMLPCDDL